MKDVDLNLLPSLQALLELRNVSRAAERMHLSQSAMSASLGRLRRHFNDELLVRAGRGYELTPFAQALAPRVDLAMAQVQDALQLHADFDPASSDRTFVIAASDYVTGVLLRHVRARIADEAPGIRVDIVPTARPILRGGSQAFGQIDLIIGPMGFDLPGASRSLFVDDFVVITDPGHALLTRDRLTVADIAAAPSAVGEFGGSIVTPPMRFFAEAGQATASSRGSRASRRCPRSSRAATSSPSCPDSSRPRRPATAGSSRSTSPTSSTSPSSRGCSGTPCRPPTPATPGCVSSSARRSATCPTRCSTSTPCGSPPPDELSIVSIAPSPERRFPASPGAPTMRAGTTSPRVGTAARPVPRRGPPRP